MKPLKTLTLAVILMTNVQSAAKAQIPDALAIRAILGEAENQGYRGMLAVACGIRNRGSLKGVYGVDAKRPNTPGVIQKRYWDLARRAWAESKTNRIHEADHWENIVMFGKPTWAKRMKLVCVIGDHVFYKTSKVKP